MRSVNLPRIVQVQPSLPLLRLAFKMCLINRHASQGAEPTPPDRCWIHPMRCPNFQWNPTNVFIVRQSKSVLSSSSSSSSLPPQPHNLIIWPALFPPSPTQQRQTEGIKKPSLIAWLNPTVNSSTGRTLEAKRPGFSPFLLVTFTAFKPSKFWTTCFLLSYY